MKITNRKNRAVLSGLLVGLSSIYAVASYFDLGWSELNSFLFATLLFFGSIVLLAAVAVLLLKLISRIFGQSGQDSDRE